MTREEVKELLMNVETYFPNYKIQDATRTINAWHMMLADEDCMQVAMALKEYIKTDKSGFAPSIGALLGKAQVNESNFVDESVAWGMVYKAICNSNYNAESEFEKLPDDIQRAIGSYGQLRQWSMSNEFNQGVESAMFFKRLANVRERMKIEKIMYKTDTDDRIGKNDNVMIG